MGVGMGLEISISYFRNQPGTLSFHGAFWLCDTTQDGARPSCQTGNSLRKSFAVGLQIGESLVEGSKASAEPLDTWVSFQ